MLGFKKKGTPTGKFYDITVRILHTACHRVCRIDATNWEQPTVRSQRYQTFVSQNLSEAQTTKINKNPPPSTYHSKVSFDKQKWSQLTVTRNLC